MQQIDMRYPEVYETAYRTAKGIDEDIGLDFVSKEEVIGMIFDSLESGIGYDRARPMIIIGVMTYIQDVIQ